MANDIQRIDGVVHDGVEGERIDTGLVEKGQWYWIKTTDHNDEVTEWLGCVTDIGSNYVELTEPSRPHYGTRSCRVHSDEFYDEVRFEPNAKAVIAGLVDRHQKNVQSLLGEVKAITARLGVSGNLKLGQNQDPGGTSLVVMTEAPDVKAYETALVKAKDVDLPKLFEDIKKENSLVAKWLGAEALALSAEIGDMKEIVTEIESKIFNVSLYAGLIETVTKCCDGEPAAFHERLHVMQRRLYMDEECLLNYRHGGMDFQNIEKFDEWISQPENRDRVLPFQRSLVAMRVRRDVKERDWEGSIMNIFVNFSLSKSDKFTFLYLRNGERVYRLDTDLEFDELIFPNRDKFDPTSPMMVRMYCGHVDRMMTRDCYELEVKAFDEWEAKRKAWIAENPRETWKREEHDDRSWDFANPYSYRPAGFNPHEWKPFDRSNVYYDEIAKKIGADIQKYNRIALIIQGLFDRSEVFHPHPPVKTWTPEGFEAAVKLVYDGDLCLYNGPEPDLEAYIAGCNETLATGSLVVGQELFWLKKEAERENARRDGDYRWRNDHRCTTFRPYGNPGPGYLTRIKEWRPRARTALFSWEREKRGGSWRSIKETVNCNLTVPAAELFNVSAYKLGDYKRFFDDSRTRARYLAWAPMLLAAEEYHAGNTDLIRRVNKSS